MDWQVDWGMVWGGGGEGAGGRLVGMLAFNWGDEGLVPGPGGS